MAIFINFGTILSMKHNQNGFSTLLFSFIATIILLIVVIVFSVWAYSGRQKYKNNVRDIVNAAVNKAVANQKNIDNQQFLVAEQSPYTAYYGPQSYGSLVVQYPKTWSSYVNTTGGNYPLDGYFFPGTLTSVSDNSPVNFALRIRVDNEPYSQVISQYSSLQSSGLVTVSSYSLPKVPSVVGVKVTGQMLSNAQKNATDIILPLRSQTLEIWTEGGSYLSNFNTILQSLVFSP